MRKFNCNGLAVTATFYNRLSFIMTKNKQITMSAATIKE